MCKHTEPSATLDKLAHVRNFATASPSSKVHEYGIKPPQKKKGQTKELTTLQKRARSKWYTIKIVGQLINTVDESDKLHKYYRNALGCATVMHQQENKITTKYCNSRCCNVCNRIRTGKLMNAYIKQMKDFNHIEFTTLTIPNVKANFLEASLKKMSKEWSKIVDNLRKQGRKISGIRKIEITYNSEKDTYHPHFHILSNFSDGKYIIDEWLKRFPDASIKAQDTRTADENSLNEIFKYSTKVLYKAQSEGTFDIYAQAINTILSVLYGKRTFNTFGDVKKECEDIQDIESQIYEEIKPLEDANWIWINNDWFLSLGTSISQKIRLTNYDPPKIEFNLIE